MEKKLRIRWKAKTRGDYQRLAQYDIFWPFYKTTETTGAEWLSL